MANIGTDIQSIDLSGASISGKLYYIIIGKAVLFWCYVTATGTQTAVVGQFAGMPSATDTINFPASGGMSGNPYPYFQIRTDGGMRNYATVNGTSFASGIYFIA